MHIIVLLIYTKAYFNKKNRTKAMQSGEPFLDKNA